ncbi:MAG: hypothetical protein A3C53_02785 [Omnitrophica WOR_2 bacterium RIFCSPHIGHO2_02_FULL_68_15]|nr:MAG: hypothetical protein A3C53_02785 [Omnitrophica WOR_2 bacterium RIFCSPHIGHO2_02_FULL_68_15]
MTPEERLFKAVETGALASAGGGAVPAGSGGRAGPEVWVQWFQKLASAQPVRRLNQGLILLLVLVTSYLIYDVISTPRQLARELAAGRVVRTEPPELAAAPAAQAALDEFLETVRQRDVFHAPGTKTATGTTAGGAAAPLPASLTEGLRLVGIAWGPKPEAMIDDQKAKQTHFLTEGQRIRSLTVEKITQERVTLKAENGERVTL